MNKKQLQSKVASMWAELSKDDGHLACWNQIQGKVNLDSKEHVQVLLNAANTTPKESPAQQHIEEYKTLLKALLELLKNES